MIWLVTGASLIIVMVTVLIHYELLSTLDEVTPTLSIPLRRRMLLVIGAVLGLMSGYLRGIFDEVLQRLNETLISIPFLVLALIAIAAAGPSSAGNPLLVVVVVAFVYFPRVSRMARSVAIDISLRDFVTVARLRGESAWSVMRHELLPNATVNGQYSPFYREVLRLYNTLSLMTPEAMTEDVYSQLESDMENLSDLLAKTYISI